MSVEIISMMGRVRDLGRLGSVYFGATASSCKLLGSTLCKFQSAARFGAPLRAREVSFEASS